MGINYKIDNNLTGDVLKLSQGNPGALSAILGLMESENISYAIPILVRLQRCSSIKGTNLYVLYNDLCNRDYKKMAMLCSSEISNKELEELCSKQDYSGQGIAKKYIEIENAKNKWD